MFRRKNLVLLFTRHYETFDFSSIKEYVLSNKCKPLSTLGKLIFEPKNTLPVEKIAHEVLKDFVRIMKVMRNPEYLPRLRSVYDIIEDDKIREDILDILSSFDDSDDFHGRLSVSDSGNDKGSLSLKE